MASWRSDFFILGSRSTAVTIALPSDTRQRRGVNAIDSTWPHYYAFRVNKMPVGVLGASGYAGRELCALILDHPELELSFATANDQRGATVRIGRHAISFVATEDVRLTDAALVFSALPHGASKDWVSRAREAGARAVDLSADLRPGNGCEGIPYG